MQVFILKINSDFFFMNILHRNIFYKFFQQLFTNKQNILRIFFKRILSIFFFSDPRASILNSEPQKRIYKLLEIGILTHEILILLLKFFRNLLLSFRCCQMNSNQYRNFVEKLQLLLHLFEVKNFSTLLQKLLHKTYTLELNFTIK